MKRTALALGIVAIGLSGATAVPAHRPAGQDGTVEKISACVWVSIRAHTYRRGDYNVTEFQRTLENRCDQIVVGAWCQGGQTLNFTTFGRDCPQGRFGRLKLAPRERYPLPYADHTALYVFECRPRQQVFENRSGGGISAECRYPVSDASALPPAGTPRARLQNGNGLITSSDYPPIARQQGLEGNVDLTLAVDVNGRAANCVVTKSSGHAILDAAACNAVMRKARFTPAIDANGVRVPGVYSITVPWTSDL